MSRYHTITSLVTGAASLLILAGCAGGAGTMATPMAARLKVPAWARTATPASWRAAARLKVPVWARTAPPLSERMAARLIRDYGARRIGEVPLPRDPDEVQLIFGAFTRPGAHEAVASFQSGLIGARAWQTWLLEWRDTGWLAVRPITASCSGHAESALLERNGPAVLLVREACSRFGREEGRVRLLSLGATSDVELFAAAELGNLDAHYGVTQVRHAVWLTGFDAAGQAELVDLAFTERQLRSPGKAQPAAVVVSKLTTYRPDGAGLLAVSPSSTPTPKELVVTAAR